jgi:hypothetical protein
MRPETLLLLLLLPVQSSKLQEHHREGSIQSKRSITAQLKQRQAKSLSHEF